MLLSVPSLQIRYLSLLMNVTSHLARGQSTVQMYIISAPLQLLLGQKIQKKVLLCEEDIFLTPSDHQKAEDAREEDENSYFIRFIGWKRN